MGETTRRTFVKQSMTAALAAAATQAIASRAHAAENNTLRIGLVGCGGRGTGAVGDSLTADPNTRLVAMGDVFADQLAGSLRSLQGNEGLRDRIDVPPERQYVGFDCYQKVIDQVDVVLLASTPYFRPWQIEYAAEKGVHVFAEKPVATDCPTLRRCLAACEAAQAKNLTLVSGLCWRYHPPKVATLQQVLDGRIGEIISIDTNYLSGGVWEPRRERDQCDSDMEYQIRNWYYYAWLSGDHICEQAVHSIDKQGWAMGDQPPVRCRAVGGRQVRTAERYGNIFDHFAVAYEYENGVRGFHQCRHWAGTPGGTFDFIQGTQGTCDVFGHRILNRAGEVVWQYEGPDDNMYVAEHRAMYRAIRANEPINDGKYMCYSTMLAIMGRIAAYTGQVVTWDQMMSLDTGLGPTELAWGEAPQTPVATPGRTRPA